MNQVGVRGGFRSSIGTNGTIGTNGHVSEVSNVSDKPCYYCIEQTIFTVFEL